MNGLNGIIIDGKRQKEQDKAFDLILELAEKLDVKI